MTRSTMTPGEVAQLLGFDVDTIYKHLVPIAEYKALSAEERVGKVPADKILGDRWHIPRWYVNHVRALLAPPEDE